MSMTFDEKNRQVVPRCLEYSIACSLGLMRVIKKQALITKIAMKDSDARKEWLGSPSIATAVDFVAESLILKDFTSEEAIKAAKYIISKAAPRNFLIRQLASHFLEVTAVNWVEPSYIEGVNEIREDIARLKKLVRMHQENPIAWSDLALGYASLRQDDKAREAMKVALHLGNNNRFILRSASRCFMHLGEPDRSIAVLNRSGLCAVDPWIASAEISIADRAGLKIRSLRDAKDIVRNDNLTPFSRGELAISLGTLQMKSGSGKNAKRLMNQALIDPTENTLAQAEWLVKQLKVEVDSMVNLRSTVPASYEAKAVHLYYQKEFEQSLRASEMWGRFQFLSPQPIILSTFISSVHLDNDLRAIDIFDNALPAQREDSIVVNNYAFALARYGLIDYAVNALNLIKTDEISDEEKLTISATCGLIAFREGHIEEGRNLYKAAVKGFELINDPSSAAIANYYWAVEEKRVRSEEAASRIKDAKSRIKRFNVFGYEDLVKKL